MKLAESLVQLMPGTTVDGQAIVSTSERDTGRIGTAILELRPSLIRMLVLNTIETPLTSRIRGERAAVIRGSTTADPQMQTG